MKRSTRVLLGTFASLAFIAICGVAWLALGGPCSESRRNRDADPAWQTGSLPAIATVYLGAELAEVVAESWVQGAEEEILGELGSVPGFGVLLRLAGVEFTVSNARFEDDGRGPAFLFDGRALASAGGSALADRLPPGIPRRAEVNFSVRAGLALRGEAGGLELRLRLDRSQVTMTTVRLGDRSRHFDRAEIAQRIRDVLFGESAPVLIELDPIQLDGFVLSMAPSTLRIPSEDQLAIDFEFVDVPAPSTTSIAQVRSTLPADAIVLAVSSETAHALGDYVLRTRSAKGLTPTGASGGPFAARLREFDTSRGGRVDVSLMALRCRTFCGFVTASVALTFPSDDAGAMVLAGSPQLLESTWPIWFVERLLPSDLKLSQAGTDFLRGSGGTNFAVPMVQGRAFRVDEIMVSDTSIAAVARLHAESSE